jgi:hypothetical protein
MITPLPMKPGGNGCIFNWGTRHASPLRLSNEFSVLNRLWIVFNDRAGRSLKVSDEFVKQVGNSVKSN